MFYVFLMTSVLLILSWFLVLRSTGRLQSLEFNILPSSSLLAVAENENLAISSVISASVDREQATRKRNSRKCDANSQILKVFMHDLPSQFHFALLGWKGGGKTVWPDIQAEVPKYPGGLNMQHSIEYWLTLDLLNSEFSKNMSGRSAIRVRDSSEADIVFVPFFASISYNRSGGMEEVWGKDHVIVAHHPNSLLYARMKLWPAMFILADFGRYPMTVANVEKDVIAPYRHYIRSYVNDKSDYDSRPTLLFSGIYLQESCLPCICGICLGGMVRQELFYMLKNEKDVHFSFGNIKGDGIDKASQGMHSSKFCLNIAGDTPSSNRLFDAIASHCVPVIISDEIELPFEDVLDYSEFCIFVRTSDALREDFLINFIRNISKEEWTRMWRRLKEVEHFFEFHYPSQENDAVQMIWQAVSRKVPAIKRKVHKASRISQTIVPGEKGLISAPLPRNFG
ncbi:UNVERIFIED_CONTAM: putative arabinosyltransferase A [Sesamum calycinum]|uniref:Arabinosyltransferase A n=1 Tax=Sesamum calycinum TaxID=2727403 RepID=A0AAW2RSX5_9LAMI